MKRCFIENDVIIDDFDKDCYEDMTGLDFDISFDFVITSAYLNLEDVWTAIIECDEIWINTSFIGESNTLLADLAKRAIKEGIKDKTIYNMRSPDLIFRFIPVDIHNMLKEQNIKFIFGKDKI